jgi:hypothetical protein
MIGSKLKSRPGAVHVQIPTGRCRLGPVSIVIEVPSPIRRPNGFSRPGRRLRTCWPGRPPDRRRGGLSAGHPPHHRPRGGRIPAHTAGQAAVRFAERVVDAATRPMEFADEARSAKRDGGDQTSAVAWSDAMSGAKGAMARRISAIVSSGTPAAHSESCKCPATRLKWWIVIPRP